MLQFDLDTREPFDVIRVVNSFLKAPGDGWRATNWWLKPHPELYDKMPKQLLANPRHHFDLQLAAIGTDISDTAYSVVSDY